MQSWFNIWISITLINHINGLKEKNHTIISIVAEAFGKIWHPFIKKNSQQTSNRRETLRHNKCHLHEHISWRKAKCFPLRTGNKARESAATLPVQYPGSLDHCSKARKKQKHADCKGRNKTIFTHDMISALKIPKNLHKNN